MFLVDSAKGLPLQEFDPRAVLVYGLRYGRGAVEGNAEPGYFSRFSSGENAHFFHILVILCAFKS